MPEPRVAVKCVPALEVTTYSLPAPCSHQTSVLVSQGALGTEDLVMNKIQFGQRSSVCRISRFRAEDRRNLCWGRAVLTSCQRATLVVIYIFLKLK